MKLSILISLHSLFVILLNLIVFISIDARIKIYRDRNQLTLSQLKKEYEDWILQMHERYDDEAHCCEDQPVLVVSPANKKALRISSEGRCKRRRSLIS